ncbi:MAG: ABC transporter permease [Myxococcales bacterium]|nr:ABC transporter permease [Myxococcales bacterium]
MSDPVGLRGLVLDAIGQGRDAVELGGRTVFYVFRGRWDAAAVWQQCHAVGNRSVVFILITLAFLGAIINLQAGFQASRIIGDASLIGSQVLPLFVRQLGPTLAGMMVATRVGTGIAAEIGSMVVTEQVDALRMCNAPPADYLVKPRLIAGLIMMPALTLFGITSAFFAGMAVAWSVFGTNPATYATFDVVVPLDLIEGMLKAVCYGAVIPIIAASSGLAARGGSEGVGEATTRAVVASSLAVIVIDFFIGGGIFLLR